MIEKLIKTLQEQAAEGAEAVAFTIVLKKDYRAYTVTPDSFYRDTDVDLV